MQMLHQALPTKPIKGVVRPFTGTEQCKADQVKGIRTCMGKRPCHAKKKEAHLCGLLYQRTMQDRMATEKARIVLAACTQTSCSYYPDIGKQCQCMQIRVQRRHT